jgi:hypothetical protein
MVVAVLMELTGTGVNVQKVLLDPTVVSVSKTEIYQAIFHTILRRMFDFFMGVN